MALQDAIAWVQTTIGALDGVKNAPEYPPEQSSSFPFSVAYMGSGEYPYATDKFTLDANHEIIIEFHVAKKILPRAIATAAPFVESIPAAIATDLTLGSNVHGFERIEYEFAPDMFWDTVQTIGFRFVISGIKVR
jgi:hypothetical protein